MATKGERIEDDVLEMVQQMFNEFAESEERSNAVALRQMVEVLNQQNDKINQLWNRVAKCEELLMHHSLDIENNGVNVDALLEENKRLQGQINTPRSQRVDLNGLLDRLASQCGHFENAINHLAGRVAELEKRSESHEDTLSRLAIRVGDLESAVFQGRRD